VVAGAELSLETEALQEDLLALLLWADRNAVRLDGLNATQASLHEVFLALGAS
jgi:ABC-2 type transport system ATP-binding protein